ALTRGAHLLRSQPHGTREPLVVSPLVLAPRVVRDTKDHQLCFGPRQHAPGHQRSAEPEPATEQAPMTTERRREVRRPAARRRTERPSDQRVDRADVGSAARPDPWSVARDALLPGARARLWLLN